MIVFQKFEGKTLLFSFQVWWEGSFFHKMKIVQTLFTKWMGFRLDESIKYGNFHPQIKHFSKLKTKILRKIRTLQSLSSARGIKDIPKIPLEISSWKHKPIFTEICPTWTWTWVSFSWEFITIAYLSVLVMVWIAFLVHLVDFFTLFMYKFSSITRWYDF